MGPRGPISGAIVTDELHLDGSPEAKVFAPGYGEFSTGSGGDLEAVALAVPADALPGQPPSLQLDTLGTAAAGILGSAHSRDWKGVRATLGRMRAAWSTVRGDGAPRMVAARLTASLRALGVATRARRPVRTAQATIDAAQVTEPAGASHGGRCRLARRRRRPRRTAQRSHAPPVSARRLEPVRSPA